jgi:hypothetical protein
MKRLRPPARIELAVLIGLLGMFVAAPTPGDIGGCGQPAQELDAGTFFASKYDIDCKRCKQCGMQSTACAKECDPKTKIPESFPEHCYPLVHDGEVCLRALYNASCSEYADYMSDSNPSSPTECNFCPAR